MPLQRKKREFCMFIYTYTLYTYTLFVQRMNVCVHAINTFASFWSNCLNEIFCGNRF